jgi:hypothetical protein
MKNEEKAEAMLGKMKRTGEKEKLGQLIDVVWEADQRSRRIKIVHRALWHFVNDVCGGNLPKKQELELYEMLRMLKRHQDRLEDFIAEATKYCDELEL